MDAARTAFLQGFGREPVLIRDGASIPVVGTFASCLKVPCVLLGFGLPDDNLHSPNEKFSLDNYHRGAKTIAYFLDLVAGGAK
jgi:acetylornithine deacetylase/succinyl-diaminopimelate desuccinylase-like protein